MGCTPPIRTVTLAENLAVFSTGDTSPGNNDIVLSPDSLIQIATLLTRVRSTLMIKNATTAFQAQAYYQLTDDSITWDTAVVLGSSVQGNGDETSNWTTLSNPKRGIRFGVRCGQNSVNTLQMARISLIVDLNLIS